MYCLELNKNFETNKELFSALKTNEKNIISLKRSKIYKSIEKNQLNIKNAFIKNDKSIKSLLGFNENYIYPIINTTRYMDSHNDVHFNGIWNKTVKEQQKKVFYVDNHSLKIDDIIAWKEDVNMYVKSIPWSLVGKNYTGNTEALIFEIAKDKLVKQSAINAINEKRDLENSIRMSYVKIKLAINSEEIEYKQNKEYFDKRYNEIVNKDVVDELGYFWGVEEAKIISEGSMVLYGSNDATSIINENQSQYIEPQNDALDNKSEPQIKVLTKKLIKDIYNIKI